jgi:sensor histidine kinase regulating citrate/malate metabolism
MNHSTLWQKAGTVLALLAILAPVWYALDFVAERALHRMDMHEHMESAQLQTIVLDSATIVWKKKGRELLVNQEYFDVASIRYEQGKAIVSGVFDERETDMHEAFAQTQQQNNNNHSGPGLMAQWLMKHWLQPMYDFSFSTIAIAMEKPVGKICSMHNRFTASPLLPPPRFL